MTTSQHAAPWTMKRIIRMLSGAPAPRRRPPTGDVLTAREAVARHLFSERVQASKLDMLDYDNSVRLQTVWGFEADRRIEHAKSSDRHVAAFHGIKDADWIHLPSLAQKDYRESFYAAKGL
jgi:hypothetical protein